MLKQSLSFHLVIQSNCVEQWRCISLCVTGLNMSESQNSPPPQLGTNSSSVAIAILVPFFALIFTGFGFYLYKQRYELEQCIFSSRKRITFLSLHCYFTCVFHYCQTQMLKGIVNIVRSRLSHENSRCLTASVVEVLTDSQVIVCCETVLQNNSV